MKEEPQRYEHVFPDIEDWPIYKLSEDRRNFVQEIDEFALDRFMRKPSPQLTDIISKTIYGNPKPQSNNRNRRELE